MASPKITQSERREQRRLDGIAEVERQVQAGSLVIRQMTKAERERQPAVERPATRRT
jgi:hypothetical protein